MNIDIDLVPKDERKEKPTDVLQVAFGTVFSDHMFSMRHTDGDWKDVRIHPYGPLLLSPAAQILHYAQGIFEGMKAYRRGDRVLLFRPEMNFKRLKASAERMVMPTIEIDFALHSLMELLKIDSEWVPEVLGSSLYIRPTMIATEPKLGVRPSKEYLYYVILSPVGPYFKEGFAPVKIYVSDKYVRAVKGGTGAAKASGNYAASLLAGTDAARVGYSQVLWLDAHERKWIEEVGTMNLFVRFDDEVVTPPLGGSILPGVTRDSVLTLVKDYGLTPTERMISIDEIIEGISSGKVKEIFGCGTAAIIAPVGSLWYKDTPHEVSDGQTGELTQRLFDDLIGIQSGELEDPHDWVVPVE
ncbi:MAG: branched-chain amino acid aminotransferase [Candidatus Thorarchaeota archaeon]|nr:branched-chain amino acid aminotransferase [Candidatus Thorarchaeota archaeon]